MCRPCLWLIFPMSSRLKKPRQSCVPGSQRSTLCATAALGPAIWWRFRVSADLGHLALQFAAKFGFETVAIGRGADKKDLALKLGAQTYIDSASQDIAKEIAGLGGTRVILATAPDNRAIGSLVDALGVSGKLVLVGVSFEPFAVASAQLIPSRKSIVGWPSGTSIDSEDTLKFAAATGVRFSEEANTWRTGWWRGVDSNPRCREGFYCRNSGRVLAHYFARQKASVLERICSPAITCRNSPRVGAMRRPPAPETVSPSRRHRGRF
jgi:hypothetical protein